MCALLKFEFTINIKTFQTSIVNEGVIVYIFSLFVKTILESITSKLKVKDDLFKHLYERTFFGGSYYDKIKVGKPEEYDLDLVFNLPLLAEPDVEVSDRHGFVNVRIKEYAKLLKSPDGKKFLKLDSLMEGHYLSTQKVLQWMEGIITLALKETEKDTDGCYFEVDIGEKNLTKIYVSISKAHPAFTLKLKNKDNSITLDADLVPCFQFTDKKWPKGGYRSNPQPLKNKFFVVPKKPYDSTESEDINKYWRLSFQEQERDLMKGNEFNKMKPAIKLLKLLRDKRDHKISSYFIKTVFLWEIEERNDKSFWSEPLHYVFMQMLQKYAERLENKRIPYYWNEHFNLIGHLKDSTITGITNCLKNMIHDVKANPDDPFRISKYLVTPDQVEILKSEVSLGKKYLRQINDLDTSPVSVGNYMDHLEVSSSKHDRSSENASSDIESKSKANSDSLSNITTKSKANSDSSSNITTKSMDNSDSSSNITTKSMDNSDSSSNTTSKSNSENNMFHLRESLALSSRGLADTIEQLIEQNYELRESNKAILKICDTLNERVLNLERKCEELSEENRMLARKQTPAFSVTREFGDRFSLTTCLLQMNNNTDSNNLNN